MKLCTVVFAHWACTGMQFSFLVAQVSRLPSRPKLEGSIRQTPAAFTLPLGLALAERYRRRSHDSVAHLFDAYPRYTTRIEAHCHRSTDLFGDGNENTRYILFFWPLPLPCRHIFSGPSLSFRRGNVKKKRLRHDTFPTRSRSWIDPFAPPPPGPRYHGHAPGATKTTNRRRSWKPHASRYVGAGSVAGARSHRGPEPLAAQDGIPSPTSPRQFHWWGVLSQVSHSGQARPARVQGLREPPLASSGLPEVRFHCPLFLAG